MHFKRLRGTHDIYGDEARGFERLEAAAREVFGVFGFEEIRTPVMEEKELFTRALGNDTDVVQKEMYEFEDRSKVRIALRPEGTAGIVRAYLENNFDKREGLCKFYYVGPMFRSERPQAGRLRQFHQIGVETLGTDSPYADAEVIQCLAAYLDRAGAGGYKIKLNNLGTFEERKHFKGELKKYFEPHQKGLCEDCVRRLEKNVFRILDCKVESCRKVIEKSPPIENFLNAESKAHYAAVCEALDAVGIKYTHDFYMVRGLDYYTKTVFEITHSKLGAQDALAAGGRYDSLIETFGGKPAGAVGFAIGVERLLMCLSPEEPAQGPSANTFFIATLGEEAFREGFKLLSRLRVRGVAALMDFSAKSLKSQMRSADKSKSRYVIILGEDELKKGIFILKDMTNGSQKELGLKEAVDSLVSLRGTN